MTYRNVARRSDSCACLGRETAALLGHGAGVGSAGARVVMGTHEARDWRGGWGRAPGSGDRGLTMGDNLL